MRTFDPLILAACLSLVLVALAGDALNLSLEAIVHSIVDDPFMLLILVACAAWLLTELVGPRSEPRPVLNRNERHAKPPILQNYALIRTLRRRR